MMEDSRQLNSSVTNGTEIHQSRQEKSSGKKATIFYHEDHCTTKKHPKIWFTLQQYTQQYFFLLKGLLNNFIQLDKRNFNFLKTVSGNLTKSDTPLKNAIQSLKCTYMTFPVFLCGLQMQE